MVVVINLHSASQWSMNLSLLLCLQVEVCIFLGVQRALLSVSTVHRADLGSMCANKSAKRYLGTYGIRSRNEACRSEELHSSVRCSATLMNQPWYRVTSEPDMVPFAYGRRSEAKYGSLCAIHALRHDEYMLGAFGACFQDSTSPPTA